MLYFRRGSLAAFQRNRIQSFAGRHPPAPLFQREPARRNVQYLAPGPPRWPEMREQYAEVLRHRIDQPLTGD
ncbi:hypothetical protein WOLCODRAFT_29004 [Wolfiporia cocos MD-104 SS10]|uniref:Uncharacterized protein n=1 Tax=Wolfiporia cocos (strain MD-104) TaxID=742152 RepID=A0A2H3J5L0_WOLCO|nr:hypothetical protein WOLCODRAFT_29004 [Wolfiporia cocos MD-104 SS10]